VKDNERRAVCRTLLKARKEARTKWTVKDEVPADPILILTSASPPNHPSERILDGFFYILIRRRLRPRQW
jgi:hypothetical protein